MSSSQTNRPCHPLRRPRGKLSGFIIAFAVGLGWGWGFAPHRSIHAAAIQTLPPPLFAFFKFHGDWIEQHATDPDLRKHAVKGEAEKHYIDLDRYGNGADSALAVLPRTWKAACAQYGEDALRAHGIAPWSTLWSYRSLTEAFAAQSPELILRHAADLGHYLGDLHVPLHTTSNYDGQHTGQVGIHALWETQVPAQFAREWSGVSPGRRAVYERDWESRIWHTLAQSHREIPRIFAAEVAATEALGSHRKFAYVENGRIQQRMHSPDFCAAFHEALAGQIPRQAQSAAGTIGDAWYSAWVDAGSPPLPPLPKQRLGERIWKWITG